jgi:hypothetical protein
LRMRLRQVNVATQNTTRERNERIERSLALQFGIIAVIAVVFESTFTVTTFYYVDSPYFFIFLTLVFITFISSDPCVYLIFNSDIRSHFLKMFCNGSAVIVNSSVRQVLPSNHQTA